MMRGEVSPPWAARFRLDAKSAFEQGIRFLTKTGDSLFHPDIPAEKTRPSAREICERLLKKHNLTGDDLDLVPVEGGCAERTRRASSVGDSPGEVGRQPSPEPRSGPGREPPSRLRQHHPPVPQ